VTDPQRTPMDPNDVLFGAGDPSFLAESPGDTIVGEIVKLAASQQTDFNTGAPLYWNNGDPRMQVIATLQTTLREAGVPDDDGKRRVFIKGKSMSDGVRDAVRQAGARKLELGGVLQVTYTGDGPKERGKNPPKLYEVSYTKPDANAAQAAQANAALGLQQEQEQAPANRPQSAPNQAAAPSGAAGTVDMSTLSPEARAMIEQLQAQAAGAQA
jgi:hypothetical protein